jgi:heme A synthase
MIGAAASGVLESLGRVDPAPFFGLSLLPYLAFLWWSWRSGRMPRLALWGFALTLLFVLVTIGAALLAETTTGRQLADVDVLHGGAEAFLTLSNVLVLLGFSRRGSKQQQ